jgi:hypothetical protein
MNISGECRPGAEKIDSILVKQECFRNFKAYLAQIYRVNPTDINGKRYRVLDFRWANFGWGKDTKGMMINHPHEVWLYTCNGENNMEEWHLEEPVKVIFARNFRSERTLMPWQRSKQIQFKAIDNENFRLYEGPIPLGREKQIDLRTLSGFLAEYLSQEEIDELYPEPDEDEAASDSDIDSEAE